MRLFKLFIIGCFFVSSMGSLPSYAEQTISLPEIAIQGFTYPQANSMVKGLTIHPQNPLQFDFIIEPNQAGLSQDQIKDESLKMIKYFLASLTTPEADMWVNLSPYEKGRIIPEAFGQTLMGRDLLAQDYILKQITASLIHPDTQIGKQFWQKVYSQAQAKYGTTNLPINTFNKVWIMPDKAAVWEHGNSVFVIERHLKVMLEEDYLSFKKSLKEPLDPSSFKNTPQDDTRNIAGKIVREIVIPELEKQVNEGESFAQLRQIYNAMILATWFKQRLKDSLLGTVYVNKNKTAGVQGSHLTPQEIYKQYIQTFKKGMFNFVKEEADPATGEMIPRKYFSGGMVGLDQAALVTVASSVEGLPAQARAQLPTNDAVVVTVNTNPVEQIKDDNKISFDGGLNGMDTAENIMEERVILNETLSRAIWFSHGRIMEAFIGLLKNVEADEILGVVADELITNAVRHQSLTQKVDVKAKVFRNAQGVFLELTTSQPFVSEKSWKRIRSNSLLSMRELQRWIKRLLTLNAEIGATGYQYFGKLVHMGVPSRIEYVRNGVEGMTMKLLVKVDQMQQVSSAPAVDQAMDASLKKFASHDPDVRKKAAMAITNKVLEEEFPQITDRLIANLINPVVGKDAFKEFKKVINTEISQADFERQARVNVRGASIYALFRMWFAYPYRPFPGVKKPIFDRLNLEAKEWLNLNKTNLDDSRIQEGAHWEKDLLEKKGVGHLATDIPENISLIENLRLFFIYHQLPEYKNDDHLQRNSWFFGQIKMLFRAGDLSPEAGKIIFGVYYQRVLDGEYIDFKGAEAPDADASMNVSPEDRVKILHTHGVLKEIAATISKGLKQFEFERKFRAIQEWRKQHPNDMEGVESILPAIKDLKVGVMEWFEKSIRPQIQAIKRSERSSLVISDELDHWVASQGDYDVLYDMEDKLSKLVNDINYASNNIEPLLRGNRIAELFEQMKELDSIPEYLNHYVRLLDDIANPSQIDRHLDRKGFELKGHPEYIYQWFLIPAFDVLNMQNAAELLRANYQASSEEEMSRWINRMGDPNVTVEEKDGFLLFKAPDGTKILEISPQKSLRFFNEDGRWILRLDRFNQKTEHLEWQGDQLQRLWIKDIDGRMIPLINDRNVKSKGFYDEALTKVFFTISRNLTHLHIAQDQKIDIPVILFLQFDASFGLYLLANMSLLALDQGAHLWVNTRPHSKSLYFHLNAISDPSHDLGVYEFSKRYAEILWSPVYTEKIFNPKTKINVFSKAGKVVRVHINGVQIINYGNNELNLEGDGIKEEVKGEYQIFHNNVQIAVINNTGEDVAMEARVTKALGGIDMNSNHLDLSIKRDTVGMPLPASPPDLPAGRQDWAQMSIDGLEARIIKIESFDSKSLFSYN